MADTDGVDNQRVTELLKLLDLPTNCLICIFKFCDVVSLRNLCITCKRLNNVISEDCLWIKKSNCAIVTNQLSKEIEERCFTLLGAKERCRISTNWKQGCFRVTSYNTRIKYMSWLVLEWNLLWISSGQNILGVQRHHNHLDMQRPHYIIHSPHTEDISRFVKVDDVIFSGGRDKLICGWSTSSDQLLFRQHSDHIGDILGLSCRRNILASCSKDGAVKVWHIGDESWKLTCQRTVDVCDRVWCVAMDPSLTCLAAGSAGYGSIHPLNLYDVESGMERPLTRSVWRKGAAVFDVHWESPDCFITCGYDTITRLWDIRVGRCVTCWSDPFGAAGYCLASDLNFSLICGTSQHSRAQLWDKRSLTSIQAYFGGRSARSSPVYSVSFDSSHLFLADDRNINLLDFSINSNRSADYSSFWANFIKD